MENFINLKPKDIKLLKESIQKVMDLTEEGEEPTEDDVIEFMELADFFEDIGTVGMQIQYNEELLDSLQLCQSVHLLFCPDNSKEDAAILSR